MANIDLKNVFSYHAPLPTQPARYVALRESARSFAEQIVALTPASREQSVALTNVQQAVMWANAAIAINEKESE